MSILQDPYTAPITKKDGPWAFDPNSFEFFQVNALYHLDLQVARFQDNLTASFCQLRFLVPMQIMLFLSRKSFYRWKKVEKGMTLVTYALTDLDNNATFDPAVYTMLFWKDSTNDQV